jgi:hypothetical protein
MKPQLKVGPTWHAPDVLVNRFVVQRGRQFSDVVLDEH